MTHCSSQHQSTQAAHKSEISESAIWSLYSLRVRLLPNFAVLHTPDKFQNTMRLTSALRSLERLRQCLRAYVDHVSGLPAVIRIIPSKTTNHGQCGALQVAAFVSFWSEVGVLFPLNAKCHRVVSCQKGLISGLHCSYLQACGSA